MKTNGHPADEVTPRKAGRFAEVVDILQQNAPQGFRRARDILFEKAEAFGSKVLPLAAALKLAIELDKHALFCEVAQDKAQTKFDYEAHERFQRYLQGEADVPVGLGVAPETIPPPTVDVDDETEEVEDDE